MRTSHQWLPGGGVQTADAMSPSARPLRGLGVAALVLCLTVLHASVARADRNYLPLQQRIELADIIVVGTPTAPSKLPAPTGAHEANLKTLVQVETTLKGSLTADPEVRFLAYENKIVLGGGPRRLQQGVRYLFFLQEPFRSGPMDMIDLYDGAIELDASLTEGKAFGWFRAHPKVLMTVERQVKQACCRWVSVAPDKKGLRVLLFTPRVVYEPAAEDISLVVFIQNHGATDVSVVRRSTPLDKMTRARLTVSRDGNPVAPKTPSWFDRAGTAAYFGRYADHISTLPPGGHTRFHVQRISTAIHGWGYKEDTSFEYFPMEQEGRYVVRAELFGMFAGAPLKTGPVALQITSKPAPPATPSATAPPAEAPPSTSAASTTAAQPPAPVAPNPKGCGCITVLPSRQEHSWLALVGFVTLMVARARRPPDGARDGPKAPGKAAKRVAPTRTSCHSAARHANM